MRHTIQIYTDGGCNKNPGGTGGWAFCFQVGEKIVERYGSQENTTNNRMEMTAAIQALEMLDELGLGEGSDTVELFTDSQYLSYGMTEWIWGWQKWNWTLKTGQPVKNVELWKKLYESGRKHKVKWIWVRGHAGDPRNERVDQLVRKAIKSKTGSVTKTTAAQLSIPAEVKLNRMKGKPVSITISQEGNKSRINIDWRHLPKLIEDLVSVLRDGEEN